MKDSKTTHAGLLLLRLGALLYDAVLLCAILFAATGLLMTILHKQTPFDTHARLYHIGLLLLCFLFFGYCWTHGGQTLGMKAWKIRLIGSDGSQVGWFQSAIRFIAALLSASAFGLGFLWALFDRQAQCWHDIVSGTKLVRIERLPQTKQPVDSSGKNR
ncbi:RDD family protein [Candidatus Methylospira mobilis]|uniref:RDD family protein n=2 Tax=Candidatus Methylospira mobilis TaxID=1808979 RepID=A0A5Q0BLD4_9GAMM|nr:RDD family protein [Candidatus Methylospira mobilis]QFY42928.1 RDD family protein [Candidatus Methylospira mobilis]